MWRRALVLSAFLFAIMVVAPPARAQDDLLPELAALVDRMATALETANPEKRLAIYRAMRPELESAAARDPALPLLLVVLDGEFSAVAALLGIDMGMWELGLGAGPDDWTRAAEHFATAMTESLASGRRSPESLYALFQSLERLNSAGLAYGQLGGSSPAILTLFEQALKWGKAGLSAEEIAAREGENFDRFVRDTMSLIPPSLNPALSGPAGVAFADKLEWDREMWGTATDGIDAVADAITRGEVDTARLGAIEGRLDGLAARGPWGGDTARDFLKKWAESLPGVGKLVKALWPSTSDPEADALCGQINCDCDNLELNIGGVFRIDCLAVQDGLIQQCKATGAISGGCHPTASGPAAFPPG